MVKNEVVCLLTKKSVSYSEIHNSICGKQHFQFDQKKMVNVFPGQYIEFRFFLLLLCALNRCVWFHDFVVRIGRSVFFSYFCLIFGWLSLELPHVLFINSCMYVAVAVVFSPVRLVDSVKVFSVWIANDYWLICMHVCMYVCLYIRMFILTWNRTYVGHDSFFSLQLIGNCLPIRPNVLENNQISIQIYIWDERYAHALFIYTCVVKIHAIANSGPFSLCTYFSIATHTRMWMFFFRPANNSCSKRTKRPLLVWFKRQKLNEKQQQIISLYDWGILVRQFTNVDQFYHINPSIRPPVLTCVGPKNPITKR